MVGLVLQAAGEGAGALDRDGVAELVLAAADGGLDGKADLGVAY